MACDFFDDCSLFALPPPSLTMTVNFTIYYFHPTRAPSDSDHKKMIPLLILTSIDSIDYPNPRTFRDEELYKWYGCYVTLMRTEGTMMNGQLFGVVAVTTITIVTKMATPQQQQDQAIHPWHHY